MTGGGESAISSQQDWHADVEYVHISVCQLIEVEQNRKICFEFIQDGFAL